MSATPSEILQASNEALHDAVCELMVSCGTDEEAIEVIEEHLRAYGSFRVEFQMEHLLFARDLHVACSNVSTFYSTFTLGSVITVCLSLISK